MSAQVARRHVSLARALHARLYVNCEGRIFAAGGRVAHAKLANALSRQNRSPSAAEAPTPRDLGVPACDGELSPHLLHNIRGALHRWRQELSREMRRKPARRRAYQSLMREQQEIEKLTSRLGALQAWQADLGQGVEPVGAPFFLDAAAEATFQSALAGVRRLHPLTPLVAWQARVVFWLSGECAARRYLSAVVALVAAHPKISLREKVRSFQQTVLVLKRRSPQEPIRNLLDELAQHVRQLPAEVVRKGKFSARLRGRTFQEHCDLLVSRCSEQLADIELHRGRLAPAALAALAAADGSSVALPQRCFRPAAEQENFAQVLQAIARLAEQIGRPGYDILLAALDELPDLSQEWEYDQLRQWLDQGASVADCVWAHERNLLHYLPHSMLRIREVRRLSEAFTERGCPLDGDDLGSLVGRIQREEHLAAVRAWLRWLGSVSPAAITPRLQRVVRAAFWDRCLPSVRQPGWFERLAPWLEAARRPKDPEDFGPLLTRIAAYQQFAGRPSALPKSLRKLLNVPERRRRERDLLRTRLASGDLDAAARARLERLDSERLAPPPSAKIRRAAEEVFLLLGVETLSAVARRLAEDKCREHLHSVATLLTPDQLWDFAFWINAMNDAERIRLREVLTARERHGPEYKRHLPANQAWINRARARGIDLDPWFAPESHPEVIGGRRMEIAITSDLRHIFLMGAYFHTCLSPGDCNQLSVLTNAYDANKQVVFMFTSDEEGRKRAVARQLIAISSEFKLVGYCCYEKAVAEKLNAEEIVAAMAAYCGRLAARCGLELADQGCPEDFPDHFWYDDGECAWTSAARTAWAEKLQSPNVFLVTPPMIETLAPPCGFQQAECRAHL